MILNDDQRVQLLTRILSRDEPQMVSAQLVGAYGSKLDPVLKAEAGDYAIELGRKKADLQAKLDEVLNEISTLT